MFQTNAHIQRRRGKDGKSRQEHLQDLANEYQNSNAIGNWPTTGNVIYIDF
jgi:hypothetical protein